MALLAARGRNLAAQYQYRRGRPALPVPFAADAFGRPLRLSLAPTPAWPGGSLRGLAQDETPPEVIPWDSNLHVTDGRTPVENNGCPEGYFAQFVAIGEPGGVPVPGRGYALRCRLMATSTPATIADESGISTTEAIAVYTEAIRDTATEVGTAVKKALSWTPWLVFGGLAAVVAWKL